MPTAADVIVGGIYRICYRAKHALVASFSIHTRPTYTPNKCLYSSTKCFGGKADLPNTVAIQFRLQSANMHVNCMVL